MQRAGRFCCGTCKNKEWHGKQQPVMEEEPLPMLCNRCKPSHGISETYGTFCMLAHKCKGVSIAFLTSSKSDCPRFADKPNGSLKGKSLWESIPARTCKPILHTSSMQSISPPGCSIYSRNCTSFWRSLC